MRITFRYMAQLRQAAGVAEDTVDAAAAAPATLQALLSLLAARHDEAYRRMLFDDQGNIQPSMLFFVGDEQVQPITVRELRDGDVVTVMAPMAGGS